MIYQMNPDPDWQDRQREVRDQIVKMLQDRTGVIMDKVNIQNHLIDDPTELGFPRKQLDTGYRTITIECHTPPGEPKAY